MRDAFSYRWVAVTVFVLSSTLNYLDRQLLSFFAPAIAETFSISMTRFGLLISAFSIAYAASSLLTGFFLDRIGVNRGIRIAVAWWSAAAVASAFAPGFRVLAWCRAALGIGESAGVPSVGKLNGLYLKPEERALGAALNQIGLSLGAMIAPLWVAFRTGEDWRFPFLVSGLVGFLWIPLWTVVGKRIPARFADQEFTSTESAFALLRNRNLQLLVIANVLWMGSYSLWSNWTSVYLVQTQHLTLVRAARYVWIPPLVSNLGGFFGGWLSFAWMRKGRNALEGRRNAVWFSAVGSLSTLCLLFVSGPGWVTAIMSISFFFALSGSVNIYALPIDLFGPSRAGFAIAALTCAYGILQTVISPIIGYLSDHKLYSEMVWICTIPLLLSAWLLNRVSYSESTDSVAAL